MVRVCHVTSVHRAFDGRIFKKECRSLSRKYDVYLVAPNIEDQEIDGVKILGVCMPHSRIKRLFRLKEIINKAIAVDADIYHFHDPELIPMANRIKKKGKRVIFDSHEDIPSDILEKKYLPKPIRHIISFLYGAYEKRTFKLFDAIISVTPTIVDRLKEYNKDTYQITNYPIYVDVPIIEKKENYICFTGAINELWQIETLINSIHDIDVKLVLAGPVSDKYKKKLESLENWEKVDYKGYVNPKEVENIQKNSAAGIALLVYGSLFGGKMGTLGNTKLFEYMMTGTPIIATDFTLWKDIVNTYRCGICVNPYDAVEISEAIKYILLNPAEAQKMGENGKKAVMEKYNWGQQERVLFEAYDKVLQKSPLSCYNN